MSKVSEFISKRCDWADGAAEVARLKVSLRRQEFQGAKRRALGHLGPMRAVDDAAEQLGIAQYFLKKARRRQRFWHWLASLSSVKV